MDDDSIIMRFGLEGKVDKKQIKQEMDKAQSVVDANEVKIPTKTKEVDPKNIKQEVKSAQKVVDKTPVKMPVELPDNLKTLIKDYKAEIKSLSQLKKNPSEKKTKKLLDYDKQYAKLRKKYKDNDKVKEFDKFLESSEMPNIRIQARRTAAAQERALKEQERIANEQIRETKRQKGKSANTTTDTQTKLKEEKRKIIKNVNGKRAEQEEARQNIQKAYFRKQKATRFVEGRVEDGQTKPGMKQIYEDTIADLEHYKKIVMNQTHNGQDKKAVSIWGDPKKWDKYIEIVQGYIDKGVADYNNRDEFVPKAEKEYEDATKNLEALEAESVKRLEEINKLLGPIEKILIDPSKLTPKHYQDLFKESLPTKKFKLRKRTLTDDVADAAINRAELKKLRRGDSRAGASTPGADTKMGTRQSIMGGPYVDKKRIIRTAIGGPYADTNSYVRNAIETQKASYKLAKETLEKFIVELSKLQEVIDQRNAEANAKAEAEGRMGIAGKGRNKNDITEQEKNIALSQIATEEVGRQAKNISKGKSTADVNAFETALKASFGFLTRSFGPSIWKPLEQNVNRIMANFAGGTFKITDDPIKGEGKNYDELAKLLKEYFKDINEFFKQNPEMEQLAQVAKDLKAAARISQDAYEQALKDNMALLTKFGYNPGRIVTSVKDVSTRNKNKSPVTGNTKLTKFATDANKNLEKNTTFTKIGNVAQEENAEINKLNANTGTDSEAGKNEVVNATEKVSDTIEKTFPSGNGGDGGNNFGGGDLGDTGPSILEQIRDILRSINSYTTAIFDILPKLKLTIKREKRSKKKDESAPESDPSLYPVVAGELKDLSPRSTRVWADATRPSKYKQFSEEFKEREPFDTQRKKLVTKPYNTEEAIKRVEDILSTPTGESRVEISKDISEVGKSFGDMIKKAFGLATTTTEVDRIKNLNQAQREKELAALTKTYGIADRDRNVTSTGDKGRAFRMKSVYGYRQKNANPFKDLKLTPGIKIDINGITDALQTMIEKNMFSAQTGVNSLTDIVKLSFGGIGMPSLEKSRAQVDAANEILSIIRQAITELLQAIQNNETTLRGFEASGDAKFDDKGVMISGSDDAKAIFGQLEEQKSALNGLIAELTKMDQLSAKTGGNMTEFFKVLGFVSPELRKCNTIIGNINSGLNKNGKALKFQSRFQETLNYSFQLLTRHIGQMIKGWLLMTNPINLIKKAFSDFGSYDVKWQRTMNVIKINFQRFIKPAMEWIAQKLVNIIGFFDIISQRIQVAFGKIPISLFDQAGAESEQIRRNLEEAANVSLGFDELHDVGTDQSGANDLMGEIYKPQLSQDWIDMATKLGDTLGGFFKGDLGFGDVCKVILELLGKLLASIGKAIWGWFKETALGKWITEHWGGLLTTLLKLFVGWQLLKIAGPTLFKALFGWMSKSVITPLFSKVGGWIGKGLSFLSGKLAGLFTGSGFLAQLGAGFTSIFKGGGLIGLVKDGALTFGSALGAIIGGALIAIVGGLIGDGIHDAARDSMESNNMYDIGLMENGGKESDKKGRGVLNTVGVIGGDMLKFGSIGVGIGGMFGGPLGMLIGGGIGAAIGAVAGTIETVFSPAIDAATVSARSMNNELQKIEYYEGKVKGASAQVDNFTEIQNQLGQAVESQTNKVYEQGEQLGISKSRLDELVTSIQNGVYNTDMLSGSELGLMDSLNQLSALQDKNKTATDNLTEAKRKLQKAEMDLSITQDIEAKNYELAAARIEAAFASGVYTADEAGKQMALVLKRTNGEMKANLLEDMSPDMKKNFAEYVNTTNTGKKDMVKIYKELNDEQKSVFEQNYGDLFSKSVQDTLSEGQKIIDNTELDWSHPFQSIGKVLNSIWSMIFGGGNTTPNSGNSSNTRSVQTASFAVGTNYVPNDGLAYLHQGEAVIPKKYNQPYQPGGMSAEERAYMDKMIATMNRLDGTIAQGINVKGEFRQRGNDLVATVEKNKSKQSNTVLNNKVYAR